MNVRGPLPAPVTAALLRAMHVLDLARPPWPVLPDEEGWWLEVLHDPRAARPSEKRLGETSRWAYLRLDRHRGPLLKLKCDLCGLRQHFDYEEVLRQFGGDYNMGVLRHKLVTCPHRKLRDSVFAPCQLDYDR